MTSTNGTRRRRIILLVSLGAVALGFLLPGVVEQGVHIVYPPLPESTLPPSYRTRRAGDTRVAENLRQLGRTHQWEKVVAQAEGYCGQDCTLGIRAMRAEALTRLRRDVEATASWRTIPGSPGRAHEAPLLLLEGRVGEYQEFCESLLAAQDPAHPDPISGRAAVWVALLSQSPANPKLLLAMARVLEQRQSEYQQVGGGLLAAALIRAGKTEEALQTLEQDSPMPQVHALRALALRKEGRLGEALQEARLFRMKLDETFGTPSRQRIELLLLLRELDSPPVEGK